MARKKADIQLQRDIDTQEEWEEVMAMEGLWVVDVYQEWCGPCLALLGNFRRLKNELGDPLLNFAMAKADTIDALEKYRGRCEPTFLFFAGGILTSYIHGANAPQVQKVITEQLASEHKILEGIGERKEVRDYVITRAQEKETERLEEEEALKLAEAAKYETTKKGITLVIIKPEAVGKVADIINEIKENEFEILLQEERELTLEELQLVYAELSHEPFYEELVKHGLSGPSCLLVLTRGHSGDTVVKDWRDLLGPPNVEQAKEEAPLSFRARFGEKGFTNGLHGSSSNEAAERELTYLFPNFKTPTYQKKKEHMETTLALIRPEVYSKKDAIVQKIHEAGFKILMARDVQLTKEQAADFYKELEHYVYFDSLVDIMSSGPIYAMGLSKDEAINAWKKFIGPSNIDDAIEKAPKSLRAQFVGASGMNQIHGSENEESAREELAYFFPMEQTVAVIKPSALGFKDEIIARILESGFKIAAQMETIISPEVTSVMYPTHGNQSYYDDLVNYLMSGVSLVMVLSREGALDGWRDEIGPADPEVAKAKNPDSLRALHGTDIIHNAVHASSDKMHAKLEIRAVFGDLKFNPDGTVKGAQPNLDETSHVLGREDNTDNEGNGEPEDYSYEYPTSQYHTHEDEELQHQSETAPELAGQTHEHTSDLQLSPAGSEQMSRNYYPENSRENSPHEEHHQSPESHTAGTEQRKDSAESRSRLSAHKRHSAAEADAASEGENKEADEDAEREGEGDGEEDGAGDGAAAVAGEAAAEAEELLKGSS